MAEVNQRLRVVRPRRDCPAIAGGGVGHAAKLHQHIALLEMRFGVVRAHASSIGTMRGRLFKPSGGMAGRGHAHVQLRHMAVDADRSVEQRESFVDAASAGRQMAETMKRHDVVGVARQCLAIKIFGLYDITGLGVPVAHVPQLG